MLDLTETIWSSEEINRGLRQLPGLIAKKSQELAEKDAEVKQMEHAIKLVEAAETVKVRSEKITATEQKAYGYLASKDQRAQLISLEKEHTLISVEVSKLNNTFDAIRKAANVSIEEMKHLNYSSRTS